MNIIAVPRAFVSHTMLAQGSPDLYFLKVTNPSIPFPLYCLWLRCVCNNSVANMQRLDLAISICNHKCCLSSTPNSHTNSRCDSTTTTSSVDMAGWVTLLEFSAWLHNGDYFDPVKTVQDWAQNKRLNHNTDLCWVTVWYHEWIM